VLLGTAAIVIRLVLTGEFTWFVQRQMLIPLVLSAVIVAVLGAWMWRTGAREADDDDDHVPGVAWLFALPLVVVLGVAPTQLGAFAAQSSTSWVPQRVVEPLPPATSGRPTEVKVSEFLRLAFWDETRSLDDRPVRLTGFVINDDERDGGFWLTRFVVSCCAADGSPAQVWVQTDAELADEEWVVAEGVWDPPGFAGYPDDGTAVVEFDPTAVTVIESPDDPYEWPF
jgi:uncharacterized repeat protein (TIGR03943 family)